METNRSCREPTQHDRVPGGLPTFQLEVRAQRDHRYEVVYAPGLLATYGALLRDALGDRRYVVLTDDRVHRLYAEPLLASFHRAELKPDVLVVPEGESSKSLQNFGELIQRMCRLGVDRNAVLVNFGGGVISDLGGFVASAYMRGIRYTNFATSLIGQLDASVGGKVAVNSDAAKNFIGAFHHPVHVAGDPALLSTLSDRDMRSGLAEAIKVAIIDAPDLFERLETCAEAIYRRDPEVLVDVVGRAIEVKMDWISRDPYEADLRRPLNFGHTIGHPIETEFGYRKIRHGEAVAIGMGIATALARRRKIISEVAVDRIYALLKTHGLLGFSEPIRADSVIEHVRCVRMIRGSSQHFVLPRAIGAVEITEDITNAELVDGFAAYDDEVEKRRD